MFDWVVIGASTGSTLVAPFAPSFEWVGDLYMQAKASGCKVYLKHNLFGAEDGRTPGMNQFTNGQDKIMIITASDQPCGYCQATTAIWKALEPIIDEFQIGPGELADLFDDYAHRLRTAYQDQNVKWEEKIDEDTTP